MSSSGIATEFEFVYPDECLDSIYGKGGALAVSGDLVTRNGLSYTKKVLASRVVALMTEKTVLPHEVVEKLI